MTGRIEAQKKYDVSIQLENSKSLKKEDEIFFVCSWTCHPTGDVCFEKEWREVSEADAKARLNVK
ncbi:MAG: hypothetical protein ABL958_10645 [Bdellovibrionia bacterium]